METQQPAGRILVKARGYRQLLSAFRAYFDEREITLDAVGEHCGLPERLTSKLFLIPPLKNLGDTSLTLILQRLDLELWLVERPSEVRDEIPKRKRVPSRKTAALTG